MKTNKSLEMVEVKFEYQILNVNDNSLVYMGEIVKEYTGEQMKQIADILIANNGGFPMLLCDIGTIKDDITDDGIMDYAESHSDEDINFDELTIEISGEMPDDMKAAVAKYIPTLRVSVPYYYHVADIEEKVMIDYQLRREIYDKMAKIALSPLKGKTPFEILKEVDPEAVSEIEHDTIDEATKQMAEGHLEQKPYLNDFPYQLYCNL